MVRYLASSKFGTDTAAVIRSPDPSARTFTMGMPRSVLLASGI
jgi:hypothetical protein